MTFVRIGERVRSGAVLTASTARAASGLASLGIGPGKMVAMLLRNDFAFLEAAAAASAIGGYATPINWHATPSEARYILEDSGAQVLVGHADLVAPLLAADAVPPNVAVLVVKTPIDLAAAYGVLAGRLEGAHDWDDWIGGFDPWTAEPIPSAGAMIYTSGTTGRPKGVVRSPIVPAIAETVRDAFVMLAGMADYIDRPKDATALIATPLYHTTPYSWMQAMFPLGVNLVIEPRFDAEQLLARIEAERVTHLLVVPTIFVRLLRLPLEVRARYDVSSLRFVMHGGAPCPVQVKREMIEWLGPVVYEHYGSTEAGVITFCDSDEWLAHPGTVGRPIPGVELRIVDGAGAPVPAGTPGEILCRNFGWVDFTYHGDAAKRDATEKQGLFALGDVGFVDRDGFLHLSGRSSEIVISGGANIYPAEIEGELVTLPGVADCAVFGIPDAEYGERVCAYVLPQFDTILDGEAIASTLRGRLAAYKVPREIVVVDTLPRDDNGKILKRLLREPYWHTRPEVGTGAAP